MNNHRTFSWGCYTKKYGMYRELLNIYINIEDNTPLLAYNILDDIKILKGVLDIERIEQYDDAFPDDGNNDRRLTATIIIDEIEKDIIFNYLQNVLSFRYN